MSEGRLPLRIPGVTASTYYKIVGDLDGKTTPLILIHGGPGGGHEYLLPFAELWQRHGIPLIFYDQVGCASSTRLPEKEGDLSFWTMNLFLDELSQLVEHLKLDSYDILGQSWGAMLGPVYAAQRPKGLRKLILASGIADAKTNKEGCKLLVEALADEYRIPIQKAVETEEYGSDYKKAMGEFNRRYFWNHETVPEGLQIAGKNLSETKIHRTMTGQSFLTMKDGSLEHYSSVAGLPDITAPTLVYYGEHDTSHAVSQRPFVELIPNATEWVVPGSKHMCHLEPEVQDEVLDRVAGFLKDSA